MVRDLRRFLRVGLQRKPIIHRVAETVPLRRLHRDMPKKELNLLQLTAGLMTKTGTSPTKVVWRERLDITSLRFLLHDTPNDFGAESVTPNPASLVDRTTERAGCNSGGRLQTSIPAFTQSGTGMVRMWPPLPTRSAMTQCSSLCCMSSTRSAVNSARRRPQPSRMANVA